MKTLLIMALLTFYSHSNIEENKTKLEKKYEGIYIHKEFYIKPDEDGSSLISKYLATKR